MHGLETIMRMNAEAAVARVPTATGQNLTHNEAEHRLADSWVKHLEKYPDSTLTLFESDKLELCELLRSAYGVGD